MYMHSKNETRGGVMACAALLLVAGCFEIARAQDAIAPTASAPGGLAAGPRAVIPGRPYISEGIMLDPVEAAAGPRVDSAPRVTALTIVPQFDASITGDPRAADIMATINLACQAYQDNFSDPVTVNITFKTISTGLGMSLTYYNTFNYTDVRAALVAHAKTADDTLALPNMPNQTNNPVNNSPLMILTTAQGRTLGFTANPPAGNPDSTISLNVGLMNILDSDNVSTKYSMFSTVCHEIDEVLGSGSVLNNLKNGDPAPTGAVRVPDLFRYSATAGTRSFTTDASAQAFFSIDGVTPLVRYSQDQNGDFADWYSPGTQTLRVQDAFATPGAKPVLAEELRVLDVIGYNRIPGGGGTILPNLTLDTKSGITGPTTVRVGAKMTVSTSVLNSTTVAAGAFSVRFLLSSDTIVDAKDAILGDVPIASLAANASAPASITVPCPTLAAGNYYIVVFIDATNQVKESNESDNIFYRLAPLAVTVNHPPVIASTPTFAPNPAFVAQPVAFSVAASDPDNDALTYAWDFGDATSDTVAAPSHTYDATGAYNVKLTVSDPFGGTATSAFTIQIYYPVYTAKLSKKKFSLNFKNSADSIDVTLSNSNFAKAADGDTVYFYLSDIFTGALSSFDRGVLAKGKATGVKKSGKFTYNTKLSTIRYTVNRAALQTALKPFGAINGNVSTTVDIPVYIFLNNRFNGGVFSFSYSAKTGSSGRGK